LSTLDRRLGSTSRERFFRELLTNSAHFPVVNIFLELLLSDPLEYIQEFDFYAIIVAMLVQAWWISRNAYHKNPLPFLANLIGPAIYYVAELSFEGGGFIYSTNHIAYLSFSIVIGTLQQLRLQYPASSYLYLVTESIVRTAIPMVMYVLLEFRIDSYSGIFDFLSTQSHIFVIVVIPLLGIIVGLANANLERTLQMLRSTSLQLKQYSEWLLGKELLELAVTDPQSLTLARHDRTMLFMDIRGFTRWSENRTPEAVVKMMNGYYEAAEPVWQNFHALKVKLTADEVMLVFADTKQALQAALALREATSIILEEYGLSAGAGIHHGPVVEGLMGGRERKSYDLLGDSVNTAKRLCDSADGGELLASEVVAASPGFVFGQQRRITAKGKSGRIVVAPLLGSLPQS